MSNDQQGGTQEDDAIARLLQGAGGRDQPDAALAASVRAAVESEWRGIVAARRRRHKLTTWAAAAGAAAAAAVIWLALPPSGGPRPAVATLITSSGPVEYRDAPGADWRPLAPGTPISTGQAIRTTGSSLAALELASGVGLRLDRASRLKFDERDLASLEQGAVYVDSRIPPAPVAGGFALRTTAGTVRHLGTQYEARLAESRLRVAIREGSVRIDTPAGAVSGVAGEQIVVDRDSVTRSDLSASDPAWDWVGAVAPAFSIEGRTLAEFLSWAARETGRDVVYANGEVEREAARIVLRGSIEGLRPDESIPAVSSTTGLDIASNGGHIEVRAGSR